MTTLEELWPKFVDKEYRAEFVAQHTKQAIPFQIAALLKQHRLTQKELAGRSGIDQSSVSRAADPRYGNLSLNTLVSIAAGFDVAFIGRFVPFSELPKWFDDLAGEEFQVASFTEENEKLEAATQDVLAHVDESNVTRMNDFLLKQLRGGQRTPPRKAKLPEAPDRGTDFNPPRSGALLPSPGTSQPVPQGQGS